MEKRGLLGFEDAKDFISSLFGEKSVLINGTIAIFAAITSFITDFVWDSPTAIWLLWSIMATDWITGIWWAAKSKTLVSTKLPRMIVYLVATTVLISFSWWAAKESIYFYPLPSLVY